MDNMIYYRKLINSLIGVIEAQNELILDYEQQMIEYDSNRKCESKSKLQSRTGDPHKDAPVTGIIEDPIDFSSLSTDE